VRVREKKMKERGREGEERKQREKTWIER